ncbi:MAG: carboxypeptidase regulatory-like domain-containing protein [Candidatus Limnocylindrales bacterium]
MRVTARTAGLTALITGLFLVATLVGPVVAVDRSAAAQSSGDLVLVKVRAGRGADAKAALHKRHGGTVVGEISRLGVQVVRVGNGQARDAARGYRGDSDVAFAEPDATVSATDVPNDPYYSSQWGLAKIGAPGAWSMTHGSSSVVVAVLDSGVSTSQPDVAGKVVMSQNFSDSTTLDDIYGHGTHVAGIAAAATNNGTGGAGVGYSVSIANVKVLGDNGTGLYSAVSSGIIWAADHGADVINMSLGGTASSSTLQSAIDYAWNKGVVVVAAAGNGATSAPFYPAYYSNVIAVAATDNLDHLASFSDYGDWVDVAAPGVSIYSTVPGGYGYKSGTSMASPFVAGLAGLLFSRVSDTNGNGRLNDEVRSRIESTADSVGLPIGGGRIDANQAAQGSTSAPTTGTISGTVSDAQDGSAIAGATVSDGTRSATADASGRYTLANVPAGGDTVKAAASGYGSASRAVTVTAGQTLPANLTLTALPANGAVSGTITDSASSKGIAGATVSDGSTTATTDSAGAYTLANLPAGSYSLTAAASGFAGASRTVAVIAGQTATAAFALTATAAAGTIGGTVVNATTHAPIGGATVKMGTTSTTADSKGAYLFANVASGSYKVSASAVGYATVSQTVSVAAGQSAASVDFGLPPQFVDVKSISIRLSHGNLRTDVTIVDGNGKSVSGATVTLTEAWSGGTTMTFTAKTNSSGVMSFTWQSPAKGTYTATVTRLVCSLPWNTSLGVSSAKITL